MSDTSTVINVIENTAYYAQQVTPPYQNRVIGPDITIDLSDDVLIITDDDA